MTCPVCGGDTIVLDSRPRPDTVHRRRKCLNCDHRFSTYEVDKELYDKLTWSIDEFFETNEEQMQKIIHGALDQIKARLYSDYIRSGKRGEHEQNKR